MNSGLLFLLSAAPQSHEPQLIDIDRTALVQLGIFLLLVVVLGRLLWRPYLRVRAERVSRVEGYREEAARLEADAAQRLGQAEAALGEARKQGTAVRAAARMQAQEREQAVVAEANAEARRALAAALARLEETLGATRAELEREAAGVARAAASKILGRDVAPEVRS